MLKLIRSGEAVTRAQIVQQTGLARSTVTQRVDALVAAGLIYEAGDSLSTGGRRPTRLAFRHDSGVVLSADLGATHSRVAVHDLAAGPEAETAFDAEIADGPERTLALVHERFLALLDEAGRDPARVRGIGVGVPGPVAFGTGKAVNPPIMPGWDRFSIPDWFADRFPGAPVLVDNDVNIMALGERAAAWPKIDHLMFVKIATGIGAGVISGGQLLRGAQGVAGDIGHVRVARGSDVPCSCGNRGCLEALASGPAIARELRAQGVDASNGNDVVDLVKHGNIDAIQAVRQAGRDIGEVLTACVSLMNPSVIAIGGSMARVGEHLIAGVREVVYTRSTPLATEHLSIVQSSAAENAGVRGAGMLAIEHALSPAALHMLVSA